MPKKVAIIGAGPSGLVTAKTLLHNFPHGTFSPIIFDTQSELGGLWRKHHANPVNDPPVTLDPRMRTNLSRFTVAFSDLDWESVIPAQLPVFPHAKQVGVYLNTYARRYLPSEVFRLGCRVVGSTRHVGDEGGVKWSVKWVRESVQDTETQSGNAALGDEVVVEDFDLIVVASGYFAEKYIPNIPGLEEFPGPVIHSSSLHYEREKLLCENNGNNANGKTVVIGGSMSGVEAASTVALHHSSSSFPNHSAKCKANQRIVHHIHSRPFWTLPTYLPHESSGLPSFIPLDLAMYDLSRRSASPIEYTLGPIPAEKAIKTNNYFHSVLGTEYEKLAHRDSSSNEESKTQPPWVAIGNDYAEFVRSGMVQTSMGKVIAVHSNQDTGLASVQYEGREGTKTIEGVTVIVMATGFTPFKSLFFLPDDVLNTLEYSCADPFSPLILDKGGTVRAEICDIGFVGFYRGPYWGVMEMQARYLGYLWAGSGYVDCRDNEKVKLRNLRSADPDLAGQFPMGDYVGLMETFARDLGLTRLELDAGNDRSGPAVPARYLDEQETIPGEPVISKGESQKTLGALRDALGAGHDMAQKGAASAIFRALHGCWKSFKRRPSDNETEEFSGQWTFHPRYPTSKEYDREYVCLKRNVDSAGRESADDEVQFIMRLAETGNGTATSRIELWSSDLTDQMLAARVSQVWELTPLSWENEDGSSGQYVISARSFVSGSGKEVLYTFHFQGVSISSWTCVEIENGRAGERLASSYSFVRQTSTEDQ